MNQHRKQARQANRAADAIAGSMAQTLLAMRPTFARQFDIDEQLVTLAIAQAAMGIAATKCWRNLAARLSPRGTWDPPELYTPSA